MQQENSLENMRAEIHRLRQNWLMNLALTEAKLADLAEDMADLSGVMKELAKAQLKTEQAQAKNEARWAQLMEQLGRDAKNGHAKE